MVKKFIEKSRYRLAPDTKTGRYTFLRDFAAWLRKPELQNEYLQSRPPGNYTKADHELKALGVKLGTKGQLIGITKR